MENKGLIAPFKILTAIIDEDGTSVVAERETSSWEVAEQNLDSLRRMWNENPRNSTEKPLEEVKRGVCAICKGDYIEGVGHEQCYRDK